jgi:hypothetical protein
MNNYDLKEETRLTAFRKNRQFNTGISALIQKYPEFGFNLNKINYYFFTNMATRVLLNFQFRCCFG